MQPYARQKAVQPPKDLTMSFSSCEPRGGAGVSALRGQRAGQRADCKGVAASRLAMEEEGEYIPRESEAGIVVEIAVVEGE